jgi:hypothetical protein
MERKDSARWSWLENREAEDAQGHCVFSKTRKIGSSLAYLTIRSGAGAGLVEAFLRLNRRYQRKVRGIKTGLL